MADLPYGTPICFGCKWCALYNNGLSATCTFTVDPAPEWLAGWLRLDDFYEGPKRDIRTGPYALKECAAFEPHPYPLMIVPDDTVKP